MIEEIKSVLGISELPSGVNLVRLEELWSSEETKPYAFKHVKHFMG